ncbi:MAG: prepilin-type N-terminal cleavage/methylation domain-containing protein [Desulfobacterales bacterium]|nr:prepilin-type N-terminal cleavage/methylation domain-containing protein [Desulfobacterales bacterium]
MTNRGKSGFTLMELMVVIAIVAIMGAIVTPNLIGWLTHSRFRSAVSDLAINLKMARSTAIKRNRTCEVRFNTPDSDKYRIACLGRTVSLETYRAGAHFLGAPPALLTFTSRGLPSTNIGSEIVVSNHDNTAKYKVQVSPSGAIYTDKL